MRPRYLNIAIAVLSLIIAWIWLAYGDAVAEFVQGIERTGPGYSPEDRTTGLLAFGILVLAVLAIIRINSSNDSH